MAIPPVTPPTANAAARAAEDLVRRMRQETVSLLQQVGGVTMLLIRILRRLFPPRIDTPELRRSLYEMGYGSLCVMTLTSLLGGALLALLAGTYLGQFSASPLVIGGAASAIMRELGPMLVALMFCRSAGADNTAELGRMAVTGQIDALRAVAVDPVSRIIVPRFLSTIVMLSTLTVYGTIAALLGAATVGQLVLGIDFEVFVQSLVALLQPSDVWIGLVKSSVFGFIVGLSSCYHGLAAQDGETGTRRAVNSSVVASVVGILVANYFLTLLVG